MKFHNKLDEAYFSVLEIDESIIRNKLKDLVKNIKNKRKSLDMKKFWRTNAFKLKKGIQKWHKSTAGKRFHRNLGNFLATHLTKADLGLNLGLNIDSKKSKSESFENIDVTLEDVASILLGLNNIKTHLILELYYFEKDNEALEEFLEIFLTFTEEQSVLEIELLKSYITGKLNNDTLIKIIELFLFFIDPKQFLYEVRQLKGLSNDINEDKSLNKELESISKLNKYELVEYLYEYLK